MTPTPQPKALELANRLATRQVRNYWHASGDTPRSNGFRPDRECAEAADLLRTQHAELEALREEVERLTACLKTANAQAEHFEREWYLRGDEVERLREDAARLDSGTILLTGRDSWGEDCIIEHRGVDLRAAIDAARGAKG